MNSELDQVITKMNGIQGKYISRFDESFLLKSLNKRMIATSTATISGYREYLSEHEGEPEEFIRSLNITYSEFFRNPLTFAVLEQHVLPRLIDEKRESGSAEIRVWSAGCAAGQESYSVAILLDELLTAQKNPLSFRIFGTDISGECLATASRGVYDEAALQNIRLKHIHSCFESLNGMHSVAGRLKRRLEFSFYDLLDERSTSPPGSIYGDFDLIFCCNLLFYYTPEIRQVILNKVIHALSGGGYLVTGEAERAIVEESTGLIELFTMSAIFQKTNERKVMV